VWQVPADLEGALAVVHKYAESGDKKALAWAVKVVVQERDFCKSQRDMGVGMNPVNEVAEPVELEHDEDEVSGDDVLLNHDGSPVEVVADVLMGG